MERYVVATVESQEGRLQQKSCSRRDRRSTQATKAVWTPAAYISNDRVFFVFEGETAHATALQLARKH